jgi:DNA relaxase NicK
MTNPAALHWLTGTTYLDETDVLDVIHEATGGCEFLVIEGSKWAYRKRYKTVEGIEVMVEPSQPDTMPPVCVNVPGTACEFLGADRLQQVASILKPTRVDFAWDAVPFSVEQLGAWVDQGDMRSRFRSASMHETIMGKGGETVTLGSRESTAQIAVYDRRGPVRLEMRLRGERAELVFDVLMSSPVEWASSFLGVLRGLVDFVDRSHTSRADRAPLLPLWESFIEGAERCVVALAGTVAPSLERVRSWVEHQVAKRLYMLDEAGIKVTDFLKLGRSRMRRSDRVMLTGWRALSP